MMYNLSLWPVVDHTNHNLCNNTLWLIVFTTSSLLNHANFIRGPGYKHLDANIYIWTRIHTLSNVIDIDTCKRASDYNHILWTCGAKLFTWCLVIRIPVKVHVENLVTVDNCEEVKRLQTVIKRNSRCSPRTKWPFRTNLNIIHPLWNVLKLKQNGGFDHQNVVFNLQLLMRFRGKSNQI